MKLDHTLPLLAFDGSPGVETMQGLVISALNTPTYLPNGLPEQDSPEDKVRKYSLSLRITQEPRYVALTIEEAAFVKTWAARHLTPLGYGRLCEWIEGDDDDEPMQPAEPPA